MRLKDYFLLEETSTGGYASDGTGVSGDDDLPTGTTILGDKFVPEMVPNRLTGATKRYAPATEDWNWREFENCSGMGSQKNYSETLDSMEDLFGARFWHNTEKRSAGLLQKDKARIRKSNEIDQTANLGDDKEESASEPEQKRRVTEAELLAQDRRNISKAIDGTNSLKLKIKNMNLDVKVTSTKTGTQFEYPENVDFTLALVDISDMMGLSFSEETQNKKTVFNIKE